jgi:hypothetical protein
MDFTDPITLIEFVVIPIIVILIGIRLIQELVQYLKKQTIETPYTNDIKERYNKDDFEKPFTGE